MIGLFLLLLKPAIAVDLVFESDRNIPLTYVSLAVNTGTASDPPRLSGLTRLLGHGLLRGTKKKTKAQIDLFLDQIGGTLEVDTRAEMTTLRGVVVSKNLKAFTDLLFEIVTQPTFPASEIQKLKRKTLSLLGQSLESDSYLASVNFSRFLFMDHPYGKPILGSPQGIRSIRRTDLVDHHRDLFQSHRMILAGSGDGDKSHLANLATRLEAALPKESIETPFPYPLRNYMRRLLILDKPDRSQSVVLLGQVGIRMTDPDYFPLFLGNHALAGSSHLSRLRRRIRDEKGWSYVGYAYFKHGSRPRMWQMRIQPATEYTAAAVKETIDLIEETQREGITKSEFEYAKKSLMNSAAFMVDTPMKRVENRLLEKILELPHHFLDRFEEKLAHITLPDVNRALKKHLKPNSLSIVILGTTEKIKEAIWGHKIVSPELTRFRNYKEGFTVSR